MFILEPLNIQHMKNNVLERILVKLLPLLTLKVLVAMEKKYGKIGQILQRDKVQLINHLLC